MGDTYADILSLIDAWYVRESSDPECAKRLAELKEVLVLMDNRWKLAGQYMLLLEEYWETRNYPAASAELH